MQKRVYTYQLYRPVEFEEATATCVFARAELPHDAELRFEIRPLNCFGGRGAPIMTTHRIDSDETVARRKAKAKKKAKAEAKAKEAAKAKTAGKGK